MPGPKERYPDRSTQIRFTRLQSRVFFYFYMDMTGKLKIVFMGTPEFAVDSLDAICRNGYEVPAVVTVPDKPAGRGQAVRSSAGKQFALHQGLPLIQPSSLSDPEFIEALKILNADLFVVVAFRILPTTVFALPPKGTFNLHASLLPHYRGAAPMNWAIINGEKETGLTTFFLDKDVDTGLVILRKSMSIGVDETVGELHDRMKKAGADLVLDTIRSIENGPAKTYPQEHFMTAGDKLCKAPKINKEDCRIDWQRDAAALHNFIRGLSPHPGAYTYLKSPSGSDFYLKIYRASIINKNGPTDPGKVITDGRSFLELSTTDGSLAILEVQLAGKKKMKIDEFLRGFKIGSTWKTY